ncbi:MAG: translation initiation factor IF-2 subunit beta [Methanosarcinaceae archaeon]|nr:translation initiation factor IF-2 subunit beta [Methanosarcinaceae archaeon]
MTAIDKAYENLLNRAIEQLPEEDIESERFTIPEAKIFPEGKTTVFENFSSVADTLRRDHDHFMKFLTRELGTAGKIEGLRSIFQGRFTREQIDSNIRAYVDEYVMCSECNRPDTSLEKVDRVLVLKCAACGAHRPVKKRQVEHRQEIALNEGETYDVTIEAVGSKGDGIAKYDKFTIFVPDAAKGENLKIKIKKITGYLAFAEKV